MTLEFVGNIRAHRAGVEFDMRAGDKTVHVSVEHDALVDVSGEEHDRNEYLNMFSKHRAYFEDLAGEKYERREVKKDGSIDITQSDTARFMDSGVAGYDIQ